MLLFRPSTSNAITPLLLIQIGSIVMGWLSVIVTMKIMGYDTPEASSLIWSKHCLLIRHWGWIFMLIPLGFVAYIIYSFSKNNDATLSKPLILFCSIVTLALMFYFISAFFSAQAPTPIGPLLNQLPALIK